MSTLATRALIISDNDHLDEEKAHLLKVFGDNGYSRSQGLKAFMNASKGPRLNKISGDAVGKVHLPFIQGTTDRIARILRKHNISSSFKPLNSIRGSLKSVKDQLDPKSMKGVYLIPCSDRKSVV